MPNRITRLPLSRSFSFTLHTVVRPAIEIEQYTLEALRDYPEISFSLVNVDDESNWEMVEEFEAFGTSLFLFNSENKTKMDLTEYAFMNITDKEVFMTGLKKEIEAFTS